MVVFNDPPPAAVVTSDDAAGRLQLHFLARKIDFDCSLCGKKISSDYAATIDNGWKLMMCAFCCTNDL
jgi:hypothetical protein